MDSQRGSDRAQNQDLGEGTTQMSRFNRSLALAAVSLAALIAAQGAARAGAFAVREQSATAQGYSFAGAASGSGVLSSMFWNPATITMAPGWQSEYHLSLVVPEVKIDPVAGTSPFLLPLGPSGDIGQDAIVPASYCSYQVNESALARFREHGAARARDRSAPGLGGPGLFALVQDLLA